MPFTAGLPETGCGAGSTVAFTADLRQALPGLLRELKVKTLLDAPCGDFNWMAHTNLSGVHYIGCDYDSEHCLSTLMRESQPIQWRPKSKKVVTIDICHEKLPVADLMLCRDFLQHLPNVLVFTALKNFSSSSVPWLLATSHQNAVNEDIPKVGMFRPLNLTAQPFNLPSPTRSISDGDGRSLGLWHRSDWT